MTTARPLVIAALLLSNPALAQDTSFGGRLTTDPGKALIAVDKIAARNIYYSPDVGGTVPVFNGTVFVPMSFLSGALDQNGPVLDLGGGSGSSSGGEVLATGGNAIGTLTQGGGVAAAFDGNAAQADTASARYYPSITGYANRVCKDWGSGNSKTITKVIWTAPNNNTGVTPAGKGWKVEGSNDNSTFTTLFTKVESTSTVGQVYTTVGGSLTASAWRYSCVTLEGNAFNSANVAEAQFYETTAPGGGGSAAWALDSVFDAFVADNSGPVLCSGPAWSALGTRAPAGALIRYGGVWVNAVAMDCRSSPSVTFNCPQYRCTAVGTFRTDAEASTITTHASGSTGQDRKFNLWNRHNQRDLALKALIPAAAGSKYFETLPSNTSGSSHIAFGLLNGDARNRISIVVGEPTVVDVTWHQSAFLNAYGGYASFDSGVGINGSVKPCGYRNKFNLDFAANGGVSSASRCVTEAMGALVANMLIRVGTGVYDGSPSGKVHIWGGNGICTFVGSWAPGYCNAIGDYYDEGDDQVNQVMIPKWRG